MPRSREQTIRNATRTTVVQLVGAIFKNPPSFPRWMIHLPPAGDLKSIGYSHLRKVAIEPIHSRWDEDP
jgi:hypothetical protein